MAAIRSWARTDVGRKRNHNEDALLADDGLGLYVVADGMGGHAAGEVASAQAVKAIREAVVEGRGTVRQLEKASSAEAREAASQLMERAVLRACSQIHAAALADAQKRGMGTTVVALLVAGSRAVVGHVGDSRVYLVRGGRAHQLTEDHTMVQEQVRRGLLDRAQAARADDKNVLTRAVGIQPTVIVDTLVADLLPGDLLVLCSDGLHGYLQEDELPRVFSGDRAGLADSLVALALERGGKDNVTVICLSIDTVEGGDVDIRADVLRRIPLFQHMTYKELLSLLGVSRARQFGPGERIIAEGEQGDELFVLFRGSVDVRKGGGPIARLEAGGHFGEMGLVDRSPRSATVIAAEETSAISIDRESLLRLMRRDSLLAVKLLWSFVQVLSERLRATSDALAAARDEPGS